MLLNLFSSISIISKRRARMAGTGGAGGDAIGASSTSVPGGDDPSIPIVVAQDTQASFPPPGFSRMNPPTDGTSSSSLGNVAVVDLPYIVAADVALQLEMGIHLQW
ncbi:hypothetical protein NE237_029002 [Protea cynaroides]|uniref:Uncharacterized protein n=1 Tax=Protea cynaroides TaxID=273540 RepID=A0A9Q0GRF9_9MAGN|nr:hypothetical protein NE237_029002 [Protea cynaroides]